MNWRYSGGEGKVQRGARILDSRRGAFAHLEDFQVATLEFAEDGGHGDFSEE